MGIIKRRFAIAIVESAISAPREFHPTEVLSYCPHLLRRDSGILPLHARLHGWTGVSPHCRLSPYRWQSDICSRTVSLVAGLGCTGWLYVVCPVPVSRKVMARPLPWLIAFAIAMGKYLMIGYEIVNVRLVPKAGYKRGNIIPSFVSTLRGHLYGLDIKLINNFSYFGLCLLYGFGYSGFLAIFHFGNLPVCKPKFMM